MKIGIVGLGLIGGSLAIAFKEAGLEIVATSRKAATCQTALNRKIVDHASTDASILKTADVVFLCTPMDYVIDSAKAVIPHLKPDAVLTDVASVKGTMVAAIAPLWKNFVGGHPMAGTAKQGIDAVIAGLFIDAPYVLTPTETTPPIAIETLKKLIKILNSRYYSCSPEVHDQSVAWISHLPVFVSASLIAACLGEDDPAILKMSKSLASSGFRDTSRVGGGNPELGLMMAKQNKEALRRSLDTYRDQLDEIIQQIDTNQWEKIEVLLQKNHQQRDSFLSR
ncbi:prephenate/arogenate dehydrogenase [[Limnothrix rosea] IAM M-220]|uniref:prephenate/arogenate dehydrogenase n=1 Tax=[Limnothrix rosea] IAM M-220 TaxID=454133 RepID=UPI00095F7CD5|nr:prephenate/arogenate dehydrogenase [[Limnothrix rosea] IAM M-220]OKH19721.1 arogenate dehydrogenase [[Limnothrix rosea] IAM M-220]